MKFIKGDCIDVMGSMEANVDLIITDPPYNISWNYGHDFKDNMPNYDDWCFEWSLMALSKLKPGGVMCIINYPENNNILYSRLINTEFNYIQQLIWHYPANIGHSKRKYTRTYRTILIFSNGPDYTFNPNKQPYKNPTDKRIKKLIEAGSIGTNCYVVLNFNLCKNVSKTKKKNGYNQLPQKLVEFLIGSFSNEEDIVLDPFVGTGTVMMIADQMNRGGIGIDIYDIEQGAMT